MRSALVRTEQLAEFASQYGFGAALRLGRGESEAGGRKRVALLCAAFEAVVGALYIDSGLEAVRSFIEPLLEYIDDIDTQRQPKELITIVVPEFVPRHWWSNMLHTKTASTLRMALLFRKDIIITNIPYQVD